MGFNLNLDPTKSNLPIENLPSEIEEPKTQSYARRFFNYVADGVNYGINWSMAKVAERVVFSPAAIHHTTQTSIAYLQQVTGDDKIVHLIDAVSQRLSGSIFREMMVEGRLKNMVSCDKPFFDALVRCLVVEMVASVAKRLQDEGKPVDPITLIATVLKEVNARIKPLVELSSLATDPITDETKVEAAHCVEKLLLVFFPHGKNDLPLRYGINTLVWNRLKNYILPQKIIDYARVIKKFDGISKKEALTALPQNEIATRLVDEANVMVERIGRSILHEPASRQRVADRILSMLQVEDAASKAELSQWMADMLGQADAADREAIEALWTFMGERSEAVASHLIFTAANALDPEHKGAGVALKNLVSICADFYRDHRKELAAEYKTEQEYIDLFIPLAEKLDSVLGISSLENLLPANVGSKIHSVAIKLIASTLATYFESDIVPVINLFERMKIQEQAEKITVVDENEIPLQRVENPFLDKFIKFIQEKQPFIANKITTKVVDYLPGLEMKLQQLVQEKLVPEESRKQGDESWKNVSRVIVADQYSDFRRWLHGMIEQGLTEIITTESAGPSTLIRTAEWLFNDLLGFLLLGGQKPLTGPIHQLKLDKYAKIFLSFSNQHLVEIRRHFLDLHAKGIDPENDQEFVNHFLPLCEELTKTLVSDEDGIPLPKMLRELVAKYFKEEVPKYLAKQFRECMAPLASLEMNKKKLETMLQDAEGGTRAAAVFEKFSGLLADKISGAIENKAFDEIEKRTGLNLKLFSMPALINVRDAYVKQVIKAYIIEMMVHYLEGVDTNGAPFHAAPLNLFLERLVKVLQKHLKVDPKPFFAAASLEDSNKRKLALREAFLPLAQDLQALFRQPGAADQTNPLVTLPFANLIGDLWQKNVEQEILPDVLGELFLDVTSLSRQKIQMQQQIAADFETTHIPESCRIIAHWVADFLPPFLSRDREQVTSILYKAIADEIGEHGTATAADVTAFLQENGEAFKQRICEDLFSFFPPDGEIAKIGGPITEEYVETLLLKTFQGVAARIKQKETGTESQKDFLLNLAIRMMSIVRNHFKTLRSTAVAEGVAVTDLPHEAFVNAFGGKLHRGVPRSPVAMEANKVVQQCLKNLQRERKRLETLRDPALKKACEETIKRERHKLAEAKKILNKERLPYFAEFSKQLLDIAGIKGPEDLPFPSPLREQLWKLANQELLPLVFSELFESVLQPKTRMTLTLAGLNLLNEFLDAVPDPETTPYVPPEDPEQRKLNKACGALVLELVNIIPQSIVKTAFKLDKVKVMSAEWLGSIVRQQLCEKWTLMELIDTAFKSGITSLHPGKWEAGERGEVFMPEGEDGLHFTFPANADELEAQAMQELDEYQQTKNELRKKMVATAHKLLANNIRNFFKWPFKRLLQIWNKCVDKVFGSHAKEVRDFFHWLGAKEVFRFIEAGLQVIKVPFQKTFWFFVDLYLGYRTKGIIKNLQLDIHENLLYKLSDALMKALESKEVPKLPKDMEEVLTDAEILEAKEREMVRNYLIRLGLELDNSNR